MFGRDTSRKRPQAITSRSFRFSLFAEEGPARAANRGGSYLRNKTAFEIFISAVVVFDTVGYNAYHLPIWQFLPMWVGAMLEIEAGARALSWLSKLFHSVKLHRPSQKPMLLE